MRNRSCRRGFTLVELLVTAGVVAVVFVLFVLMGGRSRKLGQCGESMANLRQIGTLTGSYGADYQDATPSLSWQAFDTPPGVPSDLLALMQTDYRAAAVQAGLIMRRVGNDPTIVPAAAWIPYFFYNHLVLMDYAQMEGPSRMFISPGDRNRLRWATDIAAFRRGDFGANQPPWDADQYRWPYSSSYELNYAFYSPDRGQLTSISQGNVHYLAYVPDTPHIFGRRTFAEVLFPSQKAMMFDAWAWYFGRRVEYSCVIGARFPVLFADGTVQVRTRTQSQYPRDVSWGWNPQNPDSVFGMSFLYDPRSWEPPTSSAAPVQVNGYHRWTRRGLGGQDFDANQVDLP